MTILTALLDRLLSQDVARTNAAHEADRLQDGRRQLEDVHAFLVAHHDDPATHQDTAGADIAAPVHAHSSRPGPP